MTEPEQFRNEFGTTFDIVVSLNYNKLGGGGGEIRTHGRVAPTTIFKTVAFNRSATPPVCKSHKKEALNSKQEKPTSYYNKNFI